jgi:hypothetical protein
MKYKREHVPTGTVQTFNFTESHDECFGYYNVMSKDKVKQTAESWIKAWNRRHPELWRYELVEEEEQDAATV